MGAHYYVYLVAASMIKTLIIYEDGKPELERSAMLIASSLSAGKHEVRLRKASTVTIPEILAAKLFFLGAENAVGPSYAEVARVFKGMNLAGRKGAYFGSTVSAVASLKEMAQDTDIAAPGPDLVNPKPDAETVTAWLRSFS
jgi:hypothetical protein